jgi:hypothetical protein
MIKDLPKGLLSAVAAINQKSREAYVAEQAEKQKVYESKLAQKMKAPQKAGLSEAAEGTAPKTDKEKQLAAMSGDKTKITKGDVLKARGVKESWDDMLKAAREKSKPQPNGGSGKKQGSSYGGSKQKDEKEVKEDVDQIDELSKSTLGSYTKKAGKDLHRQENDMMDDNSWNRKSDSEQNKQLAKVVSRDKGIKKAVNRLTKEDIDASAAVLRASIQEGVLGTMKKLAKKAVKKVGDTLGHGSDEDLLKDLQKKMGKSNPHGKRSMASEEVEQIDELSKKTLKSYTSKAAQDAVDHVIKSSKHDDIVGQIKARGASKVNDNLTSRNASASKKAMDHAVKRVAGMEKAAKRMKEEVEQVDEALRTVSTHGKGEGAHHAVVKRDAEWNEYQVHFYKDGKHMGEGPVSHHDDKKDAQDTAESEVKRMNKKAD